MTAYRVKLKNGDFEVEIESNDREFVEDKLRQYAVVGGGPVPVSEGDQITITLAKMIKDHNISKNQTMRFLAGAVYLSLNGQKTMKTSDVTAALRDAGQVKLSNPSENLNQNVKKGFLQKVGGNEFMVTVHGKEQFGFDV